MNKKSLFVEARRILLDNQTSVKNLEEKIKKKETQIETIKTQLHQLRMSRNNTNAENGHIVIFSKKVSLPISVAYRYCTNYDAVSTDLYGRGSDYEHENLSVDLIVEEIVLYFSGREKNFYNKANFKIELHTFQQPFAALVCDCDFSVLQAYPHGHHSDNFKFDSQMIRGDKDLRSLIALLN